VKTRGVILAVDDDLIFLRSIKRLLEAHKFDVKAFASPTAFRSTPIPAETVCILLDINLAGSSGIEVRRQLMRSGVSTPVIFMTGSSSARRHEDASASGCVDILVKPFNAAQLLSAIERVRANHLLESAETPVITLLEPGAE
jgi:FixJ family two-component response regulator